MECADEENQPTEDVEAVKARIAELEAENEELRHVMGEASKILTAYVEREKEAAIKPILEKTNLCRAEDILIALLEGEMDCSSLVERVGITEQHLSRILPRPEDWQLIYRKYLKSARSIIVRKF